MRKWICIAFSFAVLAGLASDPNKLLVRRIEDLATANYPSREAIVEAIGKKPAMVKNTTTTIAGTAV